MMAPWMLRPSCTLQVNVAPGDWRHAQFTLPHQLRQLGEQVTSVVYTVDVGKAEGRYALGDAAADQRRHLDGLLEELSALHLDVRTTAVDTSLGGRRRISEAFTGGRPVPLRDIHGAPFHAYLQGLADASTRYVLHLDADILLGGGSPAWITEALAAMVNEPAVLICSPMAGPPRADGTIPRDVIAAQARSQLFGSAPYRRSADPLVFELRHMSTRWFLIDVERLRSGEIEPVLGRRGLRGRPQPDRVAPLEVTLSGHMRTHGYKRLDILGSSPGMWALHPSPRTDAFYAGLPDLVTRIEVGDVPEPQRGRYELQRSTLDWGADVTPTDTRLGWRIALGRAMRRTPLRGIAERRAQRRF